MRAPVRPVDCGIREDARAGCPPGLRSPGERRAPPAQQTHNRLRTPSRMPGDSGAGRLGFFFTGPRRSGSGVRLGRTAGWAQRHRSYCGRGPACDLESATGPVDHLQASRIVTAPLL